MRQLSPIQFPPGAFLIKFHPKFSSTLAITSQTGQFLWTDVQGELGPIHYHQVDTNGDLLLSFDISSTGEVMTFGDGGGYTHQWADREDINVNTFSHPTTIVDVFPNPPPVTLDDER
jgi:PAB-dependent poly(A)-specific ribonuclease subunit 2